ncbi:hypothetical protein [Phenylobacterium sp.]|uniref:hypothetical protein n=1 Tax=Phenylobacterium sp. TaxID=1871053 RepID=UPI00272F5B55|nr:hypothetical protein [Phenylobacterium sp.]MDP1599027.1 hypothetical protein [Phenylobacterium sp.]MDP3590455.1 hypothetical protein [Phenylobacterium sp.]
MMEATRYALRSDDAWAALADGDLLPKGYRAQNGDWRPVQFRSEWADTLDPADLAERDVALITHIDAPAGVRVLGPDIGDDGGVPIRAWRTEPLSSDEVEGLRATRIADVKAEAGRRILERFPTWKQANMNMRATELVDIRLDRELTADETAEREAMLSAAAWIKDVRAASDAIEAGLPDDADGLSAFIASTADGWPA